MSDVTDWLWIAVAIFWILSRVLPRLFRRASETPADRPPRTPAPTRPESTEADQVGHAPPPIEPR